MTIWIVEDNETDVAKISTVITEVLGKRQEPVEMYWDRAIMWESPLHPVLSTKEMMTYAKSEHPPSIVILDLFDEAGVFRAATYFDQLRHWEVTSGLQAAWIILWSVRTHLDEVQNFVKRVPARDRRVVFTDSKRVDLLRLSLENCLHSWRESLYL